MGISIFCLENSFFLVLSTSAKKLQEGLMGRDSRVSALHESHSQTNT